MLVHRPFSPTTGCSINIIILCLIGKITDCSKISEVWYIIIKEKQICNHDNFIFYFSSL